ncbi:CBS domain-containing protein [Egibacter rhizosphaerae]|uniref:CBS domain-containing protein n=1 Tax=Egibacter rhizosphaerae TaxID=1670831 RepID=A0A411YJK2_9ACTN|nr:DUF294 nucleotidyltransferase-like domain-containing protein [Egibacter rhizosphaerae]QBI21312.1 CBS domain-containing protein [Egibacter rhizosphaerae]
MAAGDRPRRPARWAAHGSQQPPAAALTDLVELLEACPAFHGLARGDLEPLARDAELTYLAEGARTPVRDARPLVVWRGALLVQDAEDRTIDLVGEVEFHAPAADTTIVTQRAALLVMLPERAIDLAWSGRPERLGATDSSDPAERIDLQTAATRSMMSTPLLTAAPDEACRVAARRMRAHGVSCLVVFRGDRVGILTDRDLRNRLVAEGASPDEPVEAFATFPVRTIAADVPAAEALIDMLAAGIHHMPVREGERLVGMVTSSDLLQLGTRSPLFLRKALDRAADVPAVASALEDLPRTVRALLDAGTSPTDTARVVSTVTDRVISRLLRLAEDEVGSMPTAFGWLAFGSQARRESTLSSDQDSGLLLPDELTPTDEEAFARLGTWMTAALERCGYPRCPGGVMASEPGWRRSRGAWEERFRDWIRTPTGDSLLGTEIGFDLRTVAGELDATTLLAPTIAEAAGNQRFLGQLAREATRYRPPLGFTGRLTVERSGDHAGTLDLKAGAMLPIADIARVHALAGASRVLDTPSRLRAASEDRRISGDLASTLRGGYDIALGLRLRGHLEQHAAGQPLTNRIDPGDLSPLVRSDLKETFQAVRLAQEVLASTYHTGMLG